LNLHKTQADELVTNTNCLYCPTCYRRVTKTALKTYEHYEQKLSFIFVVVVTVAGGGGGGGVVW